MLQPFCPERRFPQCTLCRRHCLSNEIAGDMKRRTHWRFFFFSFYSSILYPVICPIRSRCWAPSCNSVVTLPVLSSRLSSTSNGPTQIFSLFYFGFGNHPNLRLWRGGSHVGEIRNRSKKKFLQLFVSIEFPPVHHCGQQLYRAAAGGILG